MLRTRRPVGSTSAKQLVRAVLAERHPALGDAVEGGPVGVVDADPKARLGEGQAQRQANVAAPTKHDEVEIVGLAAVPVVHGRKSSRAVRADTATKWSPRSWYSVRSMGDRQLDVAARPRGGRPDRGRPIDPRHERGGSSRRTACCSSSCWSRPNALLGAWRLGTFAIDLRIYRAAAEAALGGANPWTAAVDGLGFAAPPPTLLPYFPAALLPELLAIAIYGALTLGAALIAIRTLRLPWWWLLFPPIVDSLIVLNPDVIVIALLLAGGRWTAGVSLPFKVYAALPLLIARRWVPLAVGVGLCLLSIPWWIPFIEARDGVAASLQAQSFGGLSAWGTWLLVPTALALVALRDRDAQWLAVPGLWPYTQLHYAALALPVAARSPIVAFGLSFPVALLTPLVIILYAIGVVLRRR